MLSGRQVRAGNPHKVRLRREHSSPNSSGSRWRGLHPLMSRSWRSVRRFIDGGRLDIAGRKKISNLRRDWSSPSHSGSTQRFSHFCNDSLWRQVRPRMVSGNCLSSLHLLISKSRSPVRCCSTSQPDDPISFPSFSCVRRQGSVFTSVI